MSETISSTRTAKSVAPEDLQVGEFVAVLSRIYQYPSFLWFSRDGDDRYETVRLKFLPHKNAGEPLKIKAVCLPFVLVQFASKKIESIDVRQCQLARVDKQFADLAWKGWKESSKPRKTSARK